MKTIGYNFLRKNSHNCIVYTNKVLYICIVKKSKLYVVEINSDFFYYKTLKSCYMNHDLGVSLNTLYRIDFDTRDYKNDVCTIKKRWAQ